MKKFLMGFLLLGSWIMLNGCASSYTSINPKTATYSNKQADSSVQFSYQYDILRAKGNKKYAKKEDRHGIRVVAVKITNNTDRVLLLGEDFDLYSGDRQIFALEPTVVHKKLKQGVAIYLLYLPLTFTNLTFSKSDSYGRQQTNSIPIGLALGPGIMFGNMLGAGAANTNFKNELLLYNLPNQQIGPGTTVHAPVAFHDTPGFNPLRLKMKPRVEQ